MSTSSEAYCLSDDDVRRVAGKTGLLITRYPELSKYATWDDFMHNQAQAAAVLFLVQSATSGHWMAAFNGPDNTAYVWDPLGLPLDKQRAVLTAEKRSELGEDQAEFARLLASAKAAGKKVSVNHTEFQEFAPSVNTCGRWVGMRVLHRNKNDASFRNFVLTAMRNAGLEDPDAWIVEATNPKIGGGMPAWDDTYSGGAFDAFYDDLLDRDATTLQRTIECEIDRVGTGGALAAGLVTRAAQEAATAFDPDEQRSFLQNVSSAWERVQKTSPKMSGGEFWSALQSIVTNRTFRGAGSNGVSS